MDRFKEARRLAEMGFYLFPCVPNGKTPAMSGWQDGATRELPLLEDWFLHHDYNIGIFTSRFGDNKACVVIDVDNKGKKNGDSQILRLEMEGCELPATLEQRTPTGGRHLIYINDQACKQGVNVLGEGLDIRSRGGYIVGPGSTIEGRTYEITRLVPPVPAPDWLVHRLGLGVDRDPSSAVPLAGVDRDRAISRAIEWLKTAPVAVEGQGGDHTTYKVVCQLKDFGLDSTECLSVLLDWNERCAPPWSEDELNSKVSNAYRYGREPQGVTAPEAVFSKAEEKQEVADESAHPFQVMNAEYAYIKKGAFILQETTDHKGVFKTEHLSLGELHGWYANRVMQIGKATKPISEWWVEWPQRREYEAVVFAPEQDRGSRWYNLWRGFTVEPAETPEHPTVEAFKEHALLNVCNGDARLCRWLLGFFAHLVQRPWEKPLVALVFKGRKGTGKNALVERVGALFKPHFFVADDDRYLLSNFNSHLESCLFLVLDEAAWAGDKRAEGRLKGLITGSDHNIERKGKEAYKVDNLTRVAIIGNEDWLVPASADERRFGVFNVGDGRRRDKLFFHNMRVGMEQGGYAHLLRFLMDYDLTGIDVNEAPETQGLIDQKHASLDMVGEWLLDCLHSNTLQGGDFGGEWPDRVATNRLHEALERWAKKRNIRSRTPTIKTLNKAIEQYLPSFKLKRARAMNPGDTTVAWETPGIEVLRDDWEKFIGGKVKWEIEGDNE